MFGNSGEEAATGDAASPQENWPATPENAYLLFGALHGRYC